MRTTARCSCGWQRELSEFYAGRRIRCPDCACVIEVPGEAPNLYASQRLEGELRRANAQPPGVWLPLHRWEAPQPVETRPQEPPRTPVAVWVAVAVVLLLYLSTVLAGVLADPAAHPARYSPPPSLTEPAPAEESPAPKSSPDEDPEQEDEF